MRSQPFPMPSTYPTDLTENSQCSSSFIIVFKYFSLLVYFSNSWLPWTRLHMFLSLLYILKNNKYVLKFLQLFDQLDTKFSFSVLQWFLGECFGNFMYKSSGAGMTQLMRQLLCLGSGDGVVVRALASHQSYLARICCWFSSLLREVFLQVLRFSLLLKNQHFQIQSQLGKVSPFSAKALGTSDTQIKVIYSFILF